MARLHQRWVVMLALFVVAGCSGSQPAATSTTSSSPSTSALPTTSPRPAPSTSSSPVVDPATTLAANQRSCTDFEDNVIASGLYEAFTKFAADNSSVPPGSIGAALDHFTTTVAASTAAPVKSAIDGFTKAAKSYYDMRLGSQKLTDLKALNDKYTAAMTTCTEFITPKQQTFKVRCHVGDKYDVEFDTYQAAWSSQPDHCDGVHVSGTELTEQQKNALAAAHYESETSLKTLYGLCGAINSYPANIEGFLNGRLGESGAFEAQGVLTICPDHPQAAQIQANIDAAGVAVSAASEQSQAKVEGKFAPPGKYLIGADIRPGVWQSVGDRVENCYWEVSDSSGNIMDNNFISVAPQFTITIPADASGFTNSGCSFEWVSE